MKFLVLFLLLFVNIVTVIAQSKEIPSGNASISGRITLKEKPLAGVIVNLVIARNYNGPSRTTKTDADGKYQFDGLGAGGYTIAPHAMLYVFAERNVYQPIPGKNVNLGADEHLTDIDLAMTRGGVITGKITDAEGRPVIEQRVQFDLKDEQRRTIMRPRSQYEAMISLTDDRGVYRVFGLAPGKYVVSAGEGANNQMYSPGMGRKRYQQTFYPGVRTEAESKIIELEEGGEVTEIDIRLAAEKQTYEARGRVIDSQTGKPLAGVALGFGMMQPGTNYLNNSSSSGEKTNAKGEFVLRGLTSGTYAAFIAKEEGSLFFSERAMFEVVDADFNGLEVTAQRGATISGVVSVQGAAQQDLPQLFKTFFISFYPRNGNSVSLGAAPRLNSDGTFRLTAIPAGRGQFSVVGFGGESQVMLLRIERDGVPLQSDFEVKAGEEISGLRVIVGVGSGVIRGQVNIQGGVLPVGAMLSVSARLVNSTQSIRGTQVDARGTFLFENLMAGEYELNLSPPLVPGQRPSPEYMRKRVTQKISVNGTGETNVILTLDLSEKGGNQ